MGEFVVSGVVSGVIAGIAVPILTCDRAYLLVVFPTFPA